jgi:Extensin-like protein C-terminus
MLPQMTRGVCLYLVGSFVLVSLAGCGHGFFQSEEREPWRAEAEIACLKSGAVKESADLVRIDPINGPGVCGAEFPLKVAALGENMSGMGFADDDPRPPGSIGNQPRWPVSQPPPPRMTTYPDTVKRQPGYGSPANGPVSLTAPGVAPEEDEIELPPEGTPGQAGARPYPDAQGYPPRSTYSAPYSPRSYGPSAAPQPESQPRLGPGPMPGNSIAAVGPVAVKPTATLACPIVSVLDHWLAESVQPAAMRWFGARVVEIKQISSYSCRGMNGNANAHISEHAFGNALDIAAFTLADGRRISVESGWKGVPEEQGFLHDVQASACRDFTTVLAPGSNQYHYNHIHVDLMRRAHRPIICQPAAMSGEEVAARAGGRGPYASGPSYGSGSFGPRGPMVTGSLGGSKTASHKHKADDEDDAQDD